MVNVLSKPERVHDALGSGAIKAKTGLRLKRWVNFALNYYL